MQLAFAQHAKNILAAWGKRLMVLILSVACYDCPIRVFDCSIRESQSL